MGTKLRSNTKAKTQAARGHILHTWDVLLDMGEQGLEVTLPQLAQGACKSQTISSISFGSQGGKNVDVDIITNLGENHYISCGKGAITSRRCLKQRYIELGFTKVVSSGRAIYINNLVTLGPSKPVLTCSSMNSLVPSSYLVNHYILNSLPTSNVTSVSLVEHGGLSGRCLWSLHSLLPQEDHVSGRSPRSRRLQRRQTHWLIPKLAL